MRFEEFLDITYVNSFITSCLAFKNKHAFNCFVHNYGIIKTKNRITVTIAIKLENKTNNVYEDSVCFDESVEKIELNLNCSSYFLIYLVGRKSVKYNQGIWINANTKTEIGFTSYTYRKLLNSDEKCLEDNKQYILRDYSYDNCILDCLYEKLIQTYGCLPIANELLYFEFQLHFISRGYRTSGDIEMSLTTELSLHKECKGLCLHECEKVYHNTMVTTQKFKKRNTGTVVQIFPIKYQHFVYIETLNMDFNQLTYNCGGILGFWFG